MAGSTYWYGIGYFDMGDALNSAVSAQIEVDRFVLIDEQLYGLYSIFGDGVISGWTITSNSNNLQLHISPGVGIINGLACETDFTVNVTGLPANSTLKLYANVAGSTSANRTVTFNTVLGTIPSGAILLATITTGNTTITNIDTSIMQTIGFQQIIDYEVNHHHHTGSPPKIQLDLETRGLLPGANIAPLDASVIHSGQLSIAQIPPIDHDSLQNTGLLTHPQLDSLANTVQTTNQQLFGEITSINLMKAIIFQKYQNSAVDQYFLNEFAIIPGITPDSYIDWENTTAYINESTQCISGLPPDLILPSIDGESPGSLGITMVQWQSDTDFKNASSITNLTINDGVYLSSDTVQSLTIDGFETVTTGVAGGYIGTLSETTSINATYDNSTAEQGFYSGKFETKHTYSSVFTKTYTTPQDWSQYNQLVLYIKSYSSSHEAVYMKINDSSGNLLMTFPLLSTGEITSTGNELTNGFAKKSFSLTGTLTNIGSITVYTDNISTSDDIFWLDNIYIQNINLLYPQGTLQLRYSSPTTVLFQSIDYTALIPTGCDFRVTQRVGMDIQSMLSAPFSTRLNAGDVFSTVGREIQINITFYSDPSQALTPALTYVGLQLLVQSSNSGFTINDATTFNAGAFSNMVVATDINNDAYINLQYTNVGDKYFLYENIINEIDPNNIPEFGVNGGKCPISPLQAYNSLNGQQSSGFFDATSVYRLQTTNFLIADTGNDRIIETLTDGTFVSGFGCHNRDYDTVLYGLTAVYNPVIGKLFITFSLQVPLNTYDLTRIHLNWGGNILTLDNSSDQRQTLLAAPIVYNPTTTSVTFDRVLTIVLSQNHQDLLATVTSPIYIQLDSDPQLNYIPCFVGDFIYFGRGAILRPIFANELEPGKWMIANSSIFSGYDDIIYGGFIAAVPPGYTLGQTAQQDFTTMLAASPPIMSIINNSTVAQTTNSFGTADWVFSGINFSDITLGGIWPLGNDNLLVAGIRKLSTSSTSSATPGQPTTDAQRLAGYQGIVIVINKITNIIIFTYESPEGLFPSDVFVDDNGAYVIAESSLISQAGRIIRLDLFGNIVDIISQGMYTGINDIRLLNANHTLVST